jgi:hypothetical protein
MVQGLVAHRERNDVLNDRRGSGLESRLPKTEDSMVPRCTIHMC